MCNKFGQEGILYSLMRCERKSAWRKYLPWRTRDMGIDDLVDRVDLVDGKRQETDSKASWPAVTVVLFLRGGRRNAPPPHSQPLRKQERTKYGR